jgi:hypothetical protein
MTPTIGSMVWYRPSQSPKTPETRCAAIICYVHSDTVVNLAVFTQNGVLVPMRDITLVQPGEPCAPGECEWMPYQIKQKERNEVAEAALGLIAGRYARNSEPDESALAARVPDAPSSSTG